jgi:hypothetical protein
VVVSWPARITPRGPALYLIRPHVGVGLCAGWYVANLAVSVDTGQHEAAAV